MRLYKWFKGLFTKPKRYECVCGKWLTEKEVHRVVSRSDDDELLAKEAGIPGAGSAMIAEFCAKDCPGDCNRKHK